MAKPQFSLADTIFLLTVIAAVLGVSHVFGAGRIEGYALRTVIQCVFMCLFAFVVFVFARAFRGCGITWAWKRTRLAPCRLGKCKGAGDSGLAWLSSMPSSLALSSSCI